MKLKEITKYTSDDISITDDPIPSELLRKGIESLGMSRDRYKLISYNGDPAGFVSYSIKDDSYYKIEAIYIDEKYKGIGSIAVSKIIGNNPAYSFVEPNNVKSMNMFRNLGFEIESSRIIDGEEINVMVRN